jgi:tRNA 2-thiocytidine biosynthesis protein TtcA
MQRVAVKKMLAAWEREFPGRTQTLFSALRNVEPATLADTRQFDFKGLDARRVDPPVMNECEEIALATQLEALPV